MIEVKDLSFSFPEKDLYENISFTIDEGTHCAFMGISGSGKSTLVDMIMNPDKYMYDGSIEVSKDIKIGYVRQFYPHDKSDEITTYDYICKDYIELENEMNRICSLMETAEDIEPLLDQYQTVMDGLDALGGMDFFSQIDRQLGLAGLSHIRDIPVGKLSGGEFKLIQIVKEMLHKPELIIMDEPDVFLDFENLNSLKQLINTHRGMILVITHNRYLLNNCFNKIIHLENKQLQEFDGNYLEYNFYLLGSKVEAQELAIADEEEIERNEHLIDKLRFIASYNPDASRGRALGARVKIQERLEARKIKMPFVNIKRPKIDLHTTLTSIPEDAVVEENLDAISEDAASMEGGSFAIKVENLSIAFEKPLLNDVSFEIKEGEKVAIIGANGTGKTTLLKSVFNRDRSEISIGDSMVMAYISQGQNETLDSEKTILDEFLDSGFSRNQEVYDYLKSYNFTEAKINKPIKALSGGEKNTLQIAKAAHSNANLLILDEPSSHLDTYSQLELEMALKNYNGTFLMVSHDYYTIINTVDYILLIEDGAMRKVSMRKFRKMIYDKYFNKDYLLIEEKKKALEIRVEEALKDHNFNLAKELLEPLEEITSELSNLKR